MKINYELNKKINYEINNFIGKYLYNFNDYNNILDLFDKYIKDNNYLNNCYENIYNKIENETYNFTYKELEIIKKELKEIIIDLLNNDISYKVNLMNNIKWTVEEAMNALGIPEEERNRYKELLANK